MLFPLLRPLRATREARFYAAGIKLLERACCRRAGPLLRFCIQTRPIQPVFPSVRYDPFVAGVMASVMVGQVLVPGP